MSIASAARTLEKPAAGRRGTAAQLSLWIPAGAMTLAAFRDWAASPGFPDHVRASFIEGEIFIDMSNEDPELHVMVKTVITSRIFQWCEETKRGRIYSDGMLVSNPEANLASNPD